MTSIVRSKMPPLITASLQFFRGELPSFITDAVFEQEGRERKMRKSYQAQLCRIITWLLLHMDIASRKILVRLGKKTYVSATVDEMADKLGVAPKTINRAFSFLSSMGLFESEKQTKQRFVDANGNVKLMCGVASRRLSEAFFEKLGLQKLYEENRRKKIQEQRLITTRFRFVKAFRPKKASSAGEGEAASSPSRNRLEALYMRLADMVADGCCSASELRSLKLRMGR